MADDNVTPITKESDPIKGLFKKLEESTKREGFKLVEEKITKLYKEKVEAEKTVALKQREMDKVVQDFEAGLI